MKRQVKVASRGKAKKIRDASTPTADEFFDQLDR